MTFDSKINEHYRDSTNTVDHSCMIMGAHNLELSCHLSNYAPACPAEPDAPVYSVGSDGSAKSAFSYFQAFHTVVQNRVG